MYGYWLMNKNKSGFTLVETMAVVSILGLVSLAGIKSFSDYRERESARQSANEIKKILNGVDHRLLIDGYDISKWNSTSWSNKNEIVDSLIKKELNAKESKCGGMWEPTNIKYSKIETVDCSLWEHKSPLNFDISASLIPDSTGFINHFYMDFKFKDVDHFAKEFDKIPSILNQLKASNEGKSGTFSYSLQDSYDNEITKVGCINLGVDCKLRAEFHRLGGSEYIRVDGSNSMINEHLTFIESKSASAPLQCLRWYEDTSDSTWKSESVDCGIGIYEKSPMIVESITNTSTAKRIMLDKECDVLDYDDTTKKVIRTGHTQPCGLSNNGTEAIQVLDSSYIQNAYYDKIFANEGHVDSLTSDEFTSNIANIETLISNNIRAKAVETDVLKVNLQAEIKKFIGNTEFDGIVTFNNETTFKEKSKFENGVSIINGLEIDEINAGIINSNQANIIELNANDANIVNLTATNIDSDKIHANEITANKVTADVGDFTNINEELKDIKDAINDLATETKASDNALEGKGWVTVYSGSGTNSFTPPKGWNEFKVTVSYQQTAPYSSIYHKRYENKTKTLNGFFGGLINISVSNKDYDSCKSGDERDSVSVTAVLNHSTHFGNTLRYASGNKKRESASRGCSTAIAEAEIRYLKIKRIDVYYP